MRIWVLLLLGDSLYIQLNHKKEALPAVLAYWERKICLALPGLKVKSRSGHVREMMRGALFRVL